MIEQRTEEWFQQKLGKVGASHIADVMAKTKSGPAASRKNYMMKLLCERLTGRREEGYTNAAMQHGIDLEPQARGMYEGINGVLVVESGFVDCPSIPMAGASPDGLVGDDGLVEIKCPNTATHVDFLRTGKIDPDYEKQMLFQMICTNRGWCDFVSFDDRMPQELQYKCVRFKYDAARGFEIIAEVSAFLKELDALEAEMKALMPMEKAA